MKNRVFGEKSKQAVNWVKKRRERIKSTIKEQRIFWCFIKNKNNCYKKKIIEKTHDFSPLPLYLKFIISHFKTVNSALHRL